VNTVLSDVVMSVVLSKGISAIGIASHDFLPRKQEITNGYEFAKDSSMPFLLIYRKIKK
jgi:hypothetical protein